MSLAGFQHAWNSLLWNSAQREAWIKEGLCPAADLTPAEAAAIQALNPNHIETMAGISGYGRQQMFEKILPGTVSAFISPEERYHLTYQYSRAFPARQLHPPHRSVPLLLEWLQTELAHNGERPAHFNDIIAYESAVARLQHFGRPVPYTQPGCALSPRAGLLAAGPALAEVLAALQKGESVDPFPLTPRTGYLVYKDADETHLESLHWAVYLALSECNGSRSWEDVLVPLIRQHPELRSQAEALLAWEDYFVGLGILLTPTLAK